MYTDRLREEQSRVNWVREPWFGVLSSPLLGKYWATVLMSTGIILSLVSAVALHLVRRCTRSSAGAGWWE